MSKLAIATLFVILFSSFYFYDAFADTIDFDNKYYYSNGNDVAQIIVIPDVSCTGGTTQVTVTSSTGNVNFTANCLDGNFVTDPIIVTTDNAIPEPKIVVTNNETITASLSPSIQSTAQIFPNYDCCVETPASQPVQPNYNVVLSCTDSDNDGLCNTWEKSSGLWVYYNGVTYKYLCGSYGPDTVCPNYLNKRDVYVEVDWMPGQAPDAQAIQQVKDYFLTVPSSSGKPIQVHFQIDEQLPRHYSTITSGITGNDTSEYTTLKKYWFGTQQDRDSATPTENKILTNKRQAFHYMLFGSTQDPNTATSGRAEFLGNDVVISLGSFWKGTGSTDDQAATMIHELGHNLGLDHGGVDSINCKPNYLSVMNHLYQFPILVDRNIQLSDGIGYVALNEESVSDSTGIGSSGTGKSIAWNSGEAFIPEFTPEGVDWNNNGVEDSASLNLNNISQISTCDGVGTSLNSQSDWNALNFNFKQNTGFLDGAFSASESDDPITINQINLDDYPNEPTITPLILDDTIDYPQELTPADINQMWDKRIGTAILSSSESMSNSTITDYREWIKSTNYQNFISSGESLEDDAIIKSLISSLDKATKSGMQIGGTYDKYYGEDGILLSPLKQLENGITYDDIMCKQSHQLIFLNRNGHSDPVPICVMPNSYENALNNLQDVIIGGNYICDTNYVMTLPGSGNGADESVLSQIINSTNFGGNGLSLDCSSYLQQFD